MGKLKPLTKLKIRGYTQTMANGLCEQNFVKMCDTVLETVCQKSSKRLCNNASQNINKLCELYEKLHVSKSKIKKYKLIAYSLLSQPTTTNN